MGEAGPEVADTVAARMTDLANAVFPMSPMERAPTALGLLGGRGVSLRGAEVRLKSSCLLGIMHAFSSLGLKSIAAAVLCHTYHGASNVVSACLPQCWRTPFSKEMYRCPDDST